jgi:hypothetical protein
MMKPFHGHASLFVFDGTFLPVTGPKDLANNLVVLLDLPWFSVQAAAISWSGRCVRGDDRCAINGLAGLTG